MIEDDRWRSIILTIKVCSVIPGDFLSDLSRKEIKTSDEINYIFLPLGAERIFSSGRGEKDIRRGRRGQQFQTITYAYVFFFSLFFAFRLPASVN